MKPILFNAENAEMVRAILDDRKTATRWSVKPQPKPERQYPLGWVTDSTCNKNIGCFGWGQDEYGGVIDYAKPPCQPGDILYVRETWTQHEGAVGGVIFKARCPEKLATVKKWHPSIHMPKEAARIFLRVTDVRVERLQDITIDGVEHEGIPLIFPTTKMIESEHLKKFITVWNSTIKKSDIDRYSWQSNPWVWVIEFERISKEDAYNA